MYDKARLHRPRYWPGPESAFPRIAWTPCAKKRRQTTRMEHAPASRKRLASAAVPSLPIGRTEKPGTVTQRRESCAGGARLHAPWTRALGARGGRRGVGAPAPGRAPGRAGQGSALSPFGPGRALVFPFASYPCCLLSQCMCGNSMSAPLPAIVPAARKATAAVSGGGRGFEGSEESARPLVTRGWGRSALLGLDWGGGGRADRAPGVWGNCRSRGRSQRTSPHHPHPYSKPEPSALRSGFGPRDPRPQLGGTGAGREAV